MSSGARGGEAVPTGEEVRRLIQAGLWFNLAEAAEQVLWRRKKGGG